MVSPSSKPDGFSIEYTSKSTGESTGKVDKEGNIILNLVVTNTSSSSVTVKLGSVAGYVNGVDLELSSNQEFIPKKKFPKATEYIKSLNDNSTGTTGSGVYKVHHDAISAEDSVTGQLIDATDDYRYYRSSDNYICLDMNNQSTCPDKHLYRIIGSIYEELQKDYRIKVVKETNLGSEYSWSASGSSVWNGSTVMSLLNSGDWWNGTGNEEENSLSEDAKKYISDSRYYLGRYSNGCATGVSSTDAYSYERGSLNLGTSNLYWDGKIGLIYPSDVGYYLGGASIDSINYNRSILGLPNANLFQILWTISPANSHSSELDCNVWIFAFGGPWKRRDSQATGEVYPSFYLDKNVVIIGGTGTSTNPYTIDLPQ